MNEANEPRRRRRHRIDAPQAATALKPPAAGAFRGTPTTQWSEWVLHASASYYYRARYISYEEMVRVIPDGRNSIVSDNVGGHIHYQFMGFNDAMMRNHYTTPTQTPELSTCSGTTPTTAEALPFQPLPRIQHKERDYISGPPPAIEDGKMLMSGALLPPKPDNTYGKALVASKPRISRRKHQQQQHQQQPAVPKKKERKKLEVDKRQMNSNVKVSKWLDSL
ncbi:small nuclear ribonucleoprotein Sm D3 [Fusarium falciforme]